MHPRLALDVSFGDLLVGGCAVLGAGARARRVRRIEQLFSPAGEAFVALSARSGLDLYLSALALPPGSEVLVSGLTIPHMVQILEAHELCVVPFALDPRTLAPAAGELERRATPRTRAVLFAHLFGQRAELGPLTTLARRHGWLVWEDCAQAYADDGWRGSREADLVLFSFGLIKTATAINGGLLLVRAPELLARMRALQAAWPVQPRADFARRLSKAAILHALEPPWIFERFARRCARSGRDLDEVLHAATRGFPGADFLTRLRRMPSAPLLALLERRIRRPCASTCAARRALGEQLLQAVGNEVEVFGRHARERVHWVFAVGSDEPAALVAELRTAGFDATARSSLIAVQPTGGGESPAASRNLLERLVYVPLALRSKPAERAELVRILRESAHGYELVPFDARARALETRARPRPR